MGNQHEDFVQLCVSVGNPRLNKKIIVLGTKYNILKLGKAEIISLDGTFKTTPNPFYQTFTISSFVTRGQIGLPNRRLKLFARVICLMPGKEQYYYEEAFNQVSSLIEYYQLEYLREQELLKPVEERIPNHMLMAQGMRFVLSININIRYN